MQYITHGRASSPPYNTEPGRLDDLDDATHPLRHRLDECERRISALVVTRLDMLAEAASVAERPEIHASNDDVVAGEADDVVYDHANEEENSSSSHHHHHHHDEYDHHVDDQHVDGHHKVVEDGGAHADLFDSSGGLMQVRSMASLSLSLSLSLSISLFLSLSFSLSLSLSLPISLSPSPSPSLPPVASLLLRA